MAKGSSTRHRRLALLAGVAAMVIGTAVPPVVARADDGVSTTTTTASVPDTTTTTTTSTPPATATTSAPAPDPATTEAPTSDPPTTSSDPSTTPSDESTTTAAPATAPSVPADTSTPDATTTTAAPVTTTTEAPSPAPMILAAAGPVVLAAGDVGTAVLTKSNDLSGTLTPGESFRYLIAMACNSADGLDCPGFTFTDVIPAGLTVDPTSIPGNTADRTVTYDAVTRTLTIVFNQTTTNPAGTGLTNGGILTFELGVTLPTETTIANGTVLTNTATVTQDQTGPTSASSNVTVEIPRLVNTPATKSWSPNSAVATSDATSTITLGVRNGSSSATNVTQMQVEDSTTDTWNRFDLATATVTAFPAGASGARIEVCTDNPCTAASTYASGPTIAAPGVLTVPVTASTVTGVRVVFTGPMTYEASGGGGVQLGVVLRDTLRSGGANSPTTATTVQNCATPSGTDSVGTVGGSQACASYTIQPVTLTIGGSKQFFADDNGNYAPEAGEIAVEGDNTPVSAVITATNNSAYGVAALTITDNNNVAGSEFSKADMTTFTAVYPPGATAASVTVNYSGLGSSVIPAANGVATSLGAPAGQRVTSVSVTFTGPAGAIAPGQSGILRLHGTLNNTTTPQDLNDGVTNCATIGSPEVIPGTGSASGSACGTLNLIAKASAVSIAKIVSQKRIPFNQDVIFNLAAQNVGNQPVTGLVIADPPLTSSGVPATTGNPYLSQLRMTAIGVSGVPAALGTATIQIYVGGSWVAYDPAQLTNATGMKVSFSGVLNPGNSVAVAVTTQRRAGTPSDPDGSALFSNCASARGDDPDPTDDELVTDETCVPDLDLVGDSSTATINKSISPTSIIRSTPGVAPTSATVSVRLSNTGVYNATTLSATDIAAPFFDAVDVTGLAGITAPAGANQVTIDASTDGGATWITGTATPIASAGLPAGVVAANVTGLRVTFGNSAAGDQITPCSLPSCEGVVSFNVRPRSGLRSNAAIVPSGVITNTANGAFTSAAGGPGTMGPVTANLTLAAGDPVLAVAKDADAQLGPGETLPFTLTTTNTGNGLADNLVVVDNLPPQLDLDETYVGDGGNPFSVTVSGLPTGYPAPPTPTIAYVRTGAHVDRATMSFGTWALPPGATVVVRIQVKLAPGVFYGQIVTNTMGSSTTPAAGTFRCAGASSSDNSFGSNSLYCTDPATVTVRAGGALAARKWVAGNSSLGWYNENTSTVVAAGSASCPSLTVAGTTYTSYPCIALVNQGETVRYHLTLANAGTQAATFIRATDLLPSSGDGRGSSWPATAATPANVTHTDSGGDFDTGPNDMGPGTKFTWTFATPLQSGEAVSVSFDMVAPSTIAHNGDPTVAWNSFDYMATVIGTGNWLNDLPTLSARKVGAAALFGTLQVAKVIGANPGAVDTSSMAFVYSVSCTLNGTIVFSTTGRSIAGGATQVVSADIPAGASCNVWETNTQGAVSSATLASPATATITAMGTATATITNSFPAASLTITKVIGDNDGNVDTTGIDYAISYECSFDGAVINTDDLTLGAGDSYTVSEPLPVGASCEVWETDTGGAVTDHPVGNPAVVTIVATPTGDDNTATITNDYPTGSLAVTKVVAGAAAAAGTNPFTVIVDCTFQGDALDDFPQTLTFNGAGTQTVTAPAGAACTTQESNGGGATGTTITPGDPVTIGADRTVTVTVTNTFDPATLTVTKRVVNGAAGPYTFAITCSTVDGQSGATLTVPTADGTSTFQLSDGGSRTITLLTGSRCTVTEQNVAADDTVTITDSDAASGSTADGIVTVTKTATVDFLNTFPFVCPLPMTGQSLEATSLADCPTTTTAAPTTTTTTPVVPTTGAGGLPTTGTDTSAALVFAASLVGLGLVLLIARRRRREPA